MEKQRLFKLKKKKCMYRSRNWLQPFCTSPKVVCSEQGTYKTSVFVSLVLVLLLLLLLFSSAFHSPKNPYCLFKEEDDKKKRKKNKPFKNPLLCYPEQRYKLLVAKDVGLMDDFTALLLFISFFSSHFTTTFLSFLLSQFFSHK